MAASTPMVQSWHRSTWSPVPAISMSPRPSGSAARTGRQSAIVLVDDLDAGVRTVNAYAAEHLEIQTADAHAVADRIRSAGAIFVGPYSPVSLGDYCAGSNHVLPTGGCAPPPRRPGGRAVP